MNEGWHLRIPVTVQNPHATPLWDAVVGLDLDLGKALLDAGWPSARQGTGRALQVFGLDEASFRVVEQTSLAPEGRPTVEVASRAQTGLWERTAVYDRTTRPVVHLEWVVPGALAPGASRVFMVYADSTLYGAKPAPSYPLASMAPLDSAYWVHKGTTLYGVAADLTLVASEDDTLARVDVYQFGKPRLLTGGTVTENPVRLSAGVALTLEIADEPVFVRIQSNKPVIAVGTDDATAGPIPSTDGGLVGRSFRFHATSEGSLAPPVYYLYAPFGPTTVSDGMRSYPLAPGQEFAVAESADGIVSFTAPGPFMVLAAPREQREVQIPATTGAPTGSRLFGPLHYFTRCAAGMGACAQPPCLPPNAAAASNQVSAYSFDPSTYVRVRDAITGDLRLPLSSSGKVSQTGILLEDERAWISRSDGRHCPVYVHAADAAGSDAIADDRSLLAYVGPAIGTGTPRHVAVAGGEAAREFVVSWPVDVVAFYNATTVTVQDAKGDLPSLALGQSDMMHVEPRGGPIHLKSNRPIAVLPAGAGSYFAGFGDGLNVTLGALETRGYLLSLEPRGDVAEPLVGATGPGTPFNYTLLLRNLAKDAQGRGVADTVDLALTPLPEGWTARLSEPVVRLGPGETRDIIVTIQPPADVVEGTKALLQVTATSEGNPAIVDTVRTTTIVRATRNVDVWFDAVDGPKSRDVAFDPNETRTLNVVVKNKAQIADDVIVRAVLPFPDWNVSFEDGSRLRTLPLEAGATATLELHVQAPASAASAGQLEILAESSHDASAAGHATATLRIRADLRIRLDAESFVVEAEPGTEARFNVTFQNHGSGQVGIRLLTSGALPAGWPNATIRAAGYDVEELLGIAPGAEVPIEVALQVPANASRGARANLHFTVETIAQFVDDPVASESLDLLAIASAVHRLGLVQPADVLTPDEDGTLTARVRLANDGNGDELVRIVPLALPPRSGVVLGAPAQVPVGGEGSLGFDLVLDRGTPPGLHPVVALLEMDDGASVTWAFNLSIPSRAAVSLAPLSPLQVVAGVPSEIRLRVRNDGNTLLPMPARFALPASWEANATSRLAVLTPGEEDLVTLRVTPPRDASSGTQALGPSADWATGQALSLDVRRVVLAAQPIASGSEGIHVEVRNDGDGDATEVEVLLRSGDQVIDRATLHRIPGGGSASAILAGAGDALAVEVDAGHRYGAGTRFPVEGALGGKAAPGSGLAGLVVVSIAAALATRRQRRMR